MSALLYYRSQNSLIDNLFPFILFLILIFFFAGAFYLNKINHEYPKVIENVIEPVRAQFVISNPVKNEPQKVIPKTKPVTVKKIEPAPVDLTEKNVLAQKEDEIQQEKTKQQPVRKVYGLRKVYARGLGSGGNLSDAIVGKLGNTLNTEIDTFTATQDDIKGTIVSTTTVTQAPRYKKTSKPEYTKIMIENHIEGTVKLKVLVDIDGKVKKATVISDIGYDSAQQALQATREMEFHPALRNEIPVAVWILIPIKFVMIS